MKAYVITIMNNKKSVESAKQCISSAKKFGVDVEMFDAWTPEKNAEKFLIDEKIPLHLFHNDKRYSRTERCIAAFASHYAIWKVALKLNEPVLVLEHDAVFVNTLPAENMMRGIINVGKPSYGKYKTPALGIHPLTSKSYLPGAHAYIIDRWGAHNLIDRSKVDPGPTDVFIHENRFCIPGLLKEYYPWAVEAHDKYTTIQHEGGCSAKHNWNSEYEII